ncbi:16S rRNA (uracil(1498)-N(3))-methyltransferase [Acetobacter senegalensis]|uniref:16S rRNA (uracil(1498)-N(3))-methyltransferase n=1 Tax=Acetobacter senegalensis TaxID=446692 RepID=UPI001EDBF762|nr:16S rRNA (uracil(1498)-N(3))-methyltransferase [Acetobacter senegalensis]MCG4259565.1 16S rRNA (uracil(1498)-N(3))-methyltransferase [Acetobacter senegalensis]MDN7351905.1 16S rRNA (uracil(1498)-N(3))-methyltransferase [Acetobacter senegalensis]
MSAHAHLPRLYLPADALPAAAAGSACALPPAQARYLGTVLRKQAGDSVRVFNASMGEWLATLGDIRKDKGSLTLTERLRTPQTLPSLVLAFALLKRDATDLVLRMGTELGVTSFQPLITERTNTHRVNLDRLTAIATEAAEQCERMDIPQVAEPCALTTLLGTWPENHRLFAAVERTQDRGLAPSLTFHHARAGDGLLIGPEGGLSDTECQALLARPFVAPVSLGPLVLRADTAVAAGLALMGDGLRSAQDQSQ